MLVASYPLLQIHISIWYTLLFYLNIQYHTRIDFPLYQPHGTLAAQKIQLLRLFGFPLHSHEHTVKIHLK